MRQSLFDIEAPCRAITAPLSYGLYRVVIFTRVPAFGAGFDSDNIRLSTLAIPTARGSTAILPGIFRAMSHAVLSGEHEAGSHAYSCHVVALQPLSPVPAIGAYFRDDDNGVHFGLTLRYGLTSAQTGWCSGFR